MADQVQMRGGTAGQNNNFTGAAREVTVDTTNRTLRVHDGVTPGGNALLDGATRADALTASGLEDGDLALAQAWKGWVAAMQAACRSAIEDGDDPDWPEVPQGVADLAGRF